MTEFFKTELAKKCFEDLSNKAFESKIDLERLKQGNNKLSDLAACEVAFHDMMAKTWDIASRIELETLKINMPYAIELQKERKAN